MSYTKFFSKYKKEEVIVYNQIMDGDPIVSVSVVTYQHKKFIEKCLNGILNQKTNFLYEILLGEDHSSDGTRDICIWYAEKYPEKIRLFLHNRKNNIKINGSTTGRFNFLYNLNAARGKYIAICEGDDYWTDPLKLQKQVDFLEKYTKYSYCAHNSKRLKDGELIANPLKSHTITFNNHIYSNYINTCTLIFRKDCISNMPKILQLGDAIDWGIQLWALKKSDGFFLEDDMAVYRVHQGGRWNQLSAKEMCKRGVKILKQFRKIFKEKEDKHHIEKAIKKRRNDFGY
ncbi:glycosyl transferase family 2 [Christiangramia gaetbulicola]|uniref:Glycosyl transferase family 2 n=1 Tax=Christiangramia gaetbulicola TaxID=703340 RepID=A0A2T6AJY5_9FLAO|nr:glycosyltransferase [Christiangramia gaetbulicola]PTX44086.1 glycosyl transferase family 2 [Christiangramia gaetbulicola]